MSSVVERREVELIYDLKGMSRGEQSVLSARCVKGTLFYSSRKWFEPIYVGLMRVLGRTNIQKDKSIKWFVTCSAKALKAKGNGFFVSLHRDFYSAKNCTVGYANTVAVIYQMEKLGYIDLYKGCVNVFNQGVPEDVALSFVIFKDKYLDMWKGIDRVKIPQIEDDLELIVIRDRETKQPKSTRGFKGIKEMKEHLMRINALNANHDFELQGAPAATPEYFRVFTDDPDHSGRFYIVGGGIQVVPSYIRVGNLMIDGQPTVELDFKCMHPNILHERINMYDLPNRVKWILGENFSPYDADVSDLIQANEDVVLRHCKEFGYVKYDPVRTLKKFCLLVMLNARSLQGACGAMSEKIRNDFSRKAIDRLFVGLPKGIPVKKILERLTEHNHLIEDYFFRDMGLSLMNIDSKVAYRVTEILMQEGQPVLIYHDSFIVKQEAEKLLYDAMKLAWKEEVGDNQFCYIERK